MKTYVIQLKYLSYPCAFSWINVNGKTFLQHKKKILAYIISQLMQSPLCIQKVNKMKHD